MKKWPLIPFILGIIVLACLNRPVRAQEYNMNQIISDDEYTDYLSMSASKIQEFLNMQPGILKNTNFTDLDGVSKSAATIIYNAAQNYKINPKLILTTLQKEESLLSLTNPNQIRRDFAMGYGCFDGAECIAKNAGFAKQIDIATWQYRRYIDNVAAYGYTAPTTMKWGPGLTNTLPCHEAEEYWGVCKTGTTYIVTPTNAATAALYTYSPHASSNKSFWNIWNGYSFGSRRIYPDGTLLKASNSKDIYLIQNGKKRKFASTAAFASRYSMNNVITVNPDHLFFYDQGLSIKFANYSLLMVPTGGVYLLVNDTVRAITSSGAFKAAGFLRSEVIKVKYADIENYTAGENITKNNVYPSGQILQNKKTGAIFFVQDGIRHGVISKAIYKSQFGKRKAIPVMPATIEKYPIGNLVGFKDGEIITSKNGGATYIISNGQKLPIASWEAARAYKLDQIWKNLIKTNDDSLNLHPTGPVLDVDPTISVQIAGNQ